VKKDQLSQSCKLHTWSAPLVSGQQLTSIVSHPDSQPFALFSGLASPGVSFPAQGAIVVIHGLAFLLAPPNLSSSAWWERTRGARMRH